MRHRESKRILEIDEKLSQLKHTYECFLPIYHSMDRKRLSLETDIKILQNERVKLTEGQMNLPLDDDDVLPF